MTDTKILIKIIDSPKHINPLFFNTPEEAVEFIRKKYGIKEVKGNGQH